MVRGSTTDNLSSMEELLAIYCGKSVIVASVDNHVERVAILAEIREWVGDEGLVLDWIELGVDAEHIGEFFCIPSHGINEMSADDVLVFSVVVFNECLVEVAYFLYFD